MKFVQSAISSRNKSKKLFFAKIAQKYCDWKPYSQETLEKTRKQVNLATSSFLRDQIQHKQLQRWVFMRIEIVVILTIFYIW